MRKITEEDIIGKYSQLKDSASKRGLEFNLSLLSVKNLLTAQHCFYTGISIHPDSPTQLNKLSVDRVDNRKGYIKGNVVACSSAVNSLKANLYVDQLEKLVAKCKKVTLKQK